MDTEATIPSQNSSPKNEVIADLVDSMSNVNLQDDRQETRDILDKQNTEQGARRLVIYSRSQMLRLSKSQLVKPPEGMPTLKEWFGLENEQTTHKKDGEGSSPTGARDRRFRRDPEDGDTPPRPSFRGNLTQPSQMGNFKHQSLRSTDRGDRDKDGDKERERDIREKEGQERLRNLSDKYDRDRQALPSNITSIRNKERDSVPHLNAGSSRLAAREIPPNSTSRRPEQRESAKKKIEANEDWRRGADPRPGRDDRPEIHRKDRDRDDRDRPRSRVRDLSRPRRDRSTSRRDDREKDRDRRGDRDRDDYRRGDRDDYRREREDYLRRERDIDKGVEADDPRRWRDDGKRDERVAARREREHRERVRDRPSREEGWEPSSDRHGGRWTVVEERDSRNKRSSGRDRRSGILDDGKEKEDRKDRERDRDKEREKEPAWMDTYIPNDPGAGIIGGMGGEGELDGIQAFKKGMKAMEQKEAASPEEPRQPNQPIGLPKVRVEIPAALSPDKPMDEIQLFKLMMRKEQEQKVPDMSQAPALEPMLTGPILNEAESRVTGLTRIKDQRKVSTLSNGEPAVSADREPDSALDQSTPVILQTPISSTPSASPALQNKSDAPHSLLSILSSAANGAGSMPLSTAQSTTPSLDTGVPKSTGSRFFPKPLSTDVSSPITSEQASSNSQPFNPPPGSRLLAFGTRNTSGMPGQQNINQPHLQTSHGLHPSMQQHLVLQSQSDIFQSGGVVLSQSSDVNQRPAMSEAMRAQQGFSPFEQQSRPVFESREPVNYGHNSDSLRRTSVASPVDRTILSATSDLIGGSYFNTSSDSSNLSGPGQSYDPTISGSQYATGKGSRLLKYLEEKGREGQAGGIRKPQGTVGFPSSSPNLGQRQDPSGYNGISNIHGDKRTVDELFAMLNTSGQRGNSLNQMNSGAAPGSHFGQHSNMQSLHHQQMHQQQLPTSRLDPLYESRLDDRNFVPDGMVPGLRHAPRARENNGMFADSLDDTMQFNHHRLPPQQRGLDHGMFPGAPSLYAQHGSVGRNTGIPLQQSQFRDNTPPNPLQGAQQRLPPGLANLGGRPPHEPSQFSVSAITMQQLGGIHGPVHGNGPSPQTFGNFGTNSGNQNGGLGFAGNPQMRGPPPTGHQTPNSLGQNQMGHTASNMDLRGPTNQAQLLSLSGGPNIAGIRGGFGPQGPPVQIQAPLLAMRQQQQQHLPPHMIPHQGHHVPSHLQQHGLPAGNTQDLMALLMGGGPHRE